MFCSFALARAHVVVLAMAVSASLWGGCGPSCPTHLHTSPIALVAQHRAQHPRVTSLRAEAKVDQRGKEGRIKGRVMMFLERPDHVRFDAVTQFGPAVILTSDGASFALSDFKEDRYFTGPSCERNIARMIGVALSGPDVVSVLFGDVPELDGNTSVVRCSGEGGYLVDVPRDNGLTQELELKVHEDDLKKPITQQRTQLAGLVLRDAKGRVLLRVRYDDYRKVKSGVELPFSVHVIDERNDADALLHFQEIAVDVEIPEGAFTQTPRAGLTLEEVGCD